MRPLGPGDDRDPLEIAYTERVEAQLYEARAALADAVQTLEGGASGPPCRGGGAPGGDRLAMGSRGDRCDSGSEDHQMYEQAAAQRGALIDGACATGTPRLEAELGALRAGPIGQPPGHEGRPLDRLPAADAFRSLRGG